MKLVIKEISIETGRPYIATLNREDAARLDLYPGDRIRIKKGKREITTTVNVTKSSLTVKPGEMGVFYELSKHFNLNKGDIVHAYLEDKPASVGYIKKKLEGEELTAEEMTQITQDIVDNKLTEIEMTYFVSAIFSKGLTMDETTSLTKAMTDTGNVIKFDTYPIFDKHCVGGVPGNRTTMIVIPIVTSIGIVLPKTSSRAITSPAGTADTMEVLADVEMSSEKMKRVVKKTNGCLVWGGGQINLAPADDRIIRVEHPLSIDSEDQMIASIISKKLSVSATHLLIDIPVGKGAKVETMMQAKRLEKKFLEVTKRFNIKTKVIITDGNQPIGQGIGPMLEARDVLKVLRNEKDAALLLKEKAIEMAGTIIEMADKAKKGEGAKIARKILESGKAYEQMIKIIKAQGEREIDPNKLIEAEFRYDHRADKEGKVARIDIKSIAKIARIAGCPDDKKAGVYLHKKVGDEVLKGQKLFTIFAESPQKLQYAYEFYEKMNGFIVK